MRMRKSECDKTHDTLHITQCHTLGDYCDISVSILLLVTESIWEPLNVINGLYREGNIYCGG